MRSEQHGHSEGDAAGTRNKKTTPHVSHRRQPDTGIAFGAAYKTPATSERRGVSTVERRQMPRQWRCFMRVGPLRARVVAAALAAADALAGAVIALNIAAAYKTAAA